jgi:ketosteroid isomerase-like protein
VTEGNLEVVQRGIDAFQRGDLGAWLAHMDEHVVWLPVKNFPDSRPRHGHEEVLQFAEDWIGPWDRYELETQELGEVGDVVVWTVRFIATKEGSAMRADEEMTSVFSVSRGKVIKIEWFWKREEAERALEEG